MARANPDEQLDSDINILILGETGVGKSMFINAFANYLQHPTFSNAMDSELTCLIPSKVTIPTEDIEGKVIQFGPDQNEDTGIKNSDIRGARAHLFHIEDHNIRLINTPGIGDTRGIKQDEVNFENVLNYVSQYQQLHGICFLLRSNLSVINAYFKFSMMHLISRLDMTAVKTITFVFTNSTNTFYSIGETFPLLKRVLNEIKESPPYFEVVYSEENIFCVDDEAFKFLVAIKDGIKFGNTETEGFAKSWKASHETCNHILSYIRGGGEYVHLQRVINDHSKPLVDITDFILDNLIVLEKKVAFLQQENLSEEDLVGKLYVPTIELQFAKLSQPMTVCTSSKCLEKYTCEGLTKYRYVQICHKPCHLNDLPNEIIGTTELLNCYAFNGSACRMCRCDNSFHIHMYYDSKIVSKQENVSFKREIEKEEITALLVKLDKMIADFEQEKKNISRCIAKFAYFLKENFIPANMDPYLDYWNYIIEREKIIDEHGNEARIRHYTLLKSQHYQERKKLCALKYNKRDKVISPREIPNLVQILHNLPITGSKISKLHSIQKRSVEDSINRHHKIESPLASERDSSDEAEDIPSIQLQIVPTAMPDKERLELIDQPSTVKVAVEGPTTEPSEHVKKDTLKRSYPEENVSTVIGTPTEEELNVTKLHESEGEEDEGEPSTRKDKKGKFD